MKNESLEESIDAYPVFAWNFEEPFLSSRILSGVRLTKVHVDPFVWCAAQNEEISGFFDVKNSWIDGRQTRHESVFKKGEKRITVVAKGADWTINDKDIQITGENDRIELLIDTIKNFN